MDRSGISLPLRALRLLALALLASQVGCSDFDRTRWLARFGSTEAQIEVGEALVEGQGVERDLEEGLGWLEKAAEGGALSAQLRLAEFYAERRVGDDLERVEHWLRAAAEGGDPGAQVQLANLLASRGAPDSDSWLERAAGTGDAAAQYAYGSRLKQRGADPAEVAAQFEKAAEQGHAGAAWELARALLQGDHELPEGEQGEQALLWVRRAAEAGQAEAQAALGLLYFRGQGVEQDYVEARAWFDKAAGQNNALAQESLGLIYAKGLGVVRSGEEAARWLWLAAEQGRGPSENQLGVMYSEGQIPDEETAEQIAYYTSGNGQHVAEADERIDELAAEARINNDRRAVEWFRRAAVKDYPPALANLARMLESGRGVDEADTDEAMRLYAKAADLGNPTARAALAARYGGGRGVERDDAAALANYQSAAESGHGPSQYALALTYYNGRGVARDMTKAAHWFHQAAEAGIEAAELNYGTLLATGQGVAQDDEEALRWFQRAADRGEPAAQWNIGVFHEEGRGGLRKSQRRAVEWWKKAAEQGHSFAQLKLGLAYAQGKGTRRDLPEARAWLVHSGSEDVKNWITVLDERMLPADQERSAARLAELNAAAAKREAAQQSESGTSSP